MAQTPSFVSVNCSLPIKASKLHIPVGQDSVMWFQLIAIPIISLFGITGNIFSFIILKDGALKTVSHFYLVCLSISDSLTILTFQYSFYTNLVLQPILLKFTDKVTFIERYLTNYSTCPLRTFTSFSMRLLSTWIIVIFSIDRLIVVAFPFQSRRISTVRNAAIAVGSTAVTCFLLNIPWLFGYDKAPVPCANFSRCKGNDILTYMVFVEIIFLSFIPSLIICICNISIITILRKRQDHSTLHSKQEALKQEKQITIRLILVSTAFVTLNFTSFVVVIIRTVGKLKYKESYSSGPVADAFHIGTFLYLVNLSINFILYCLTGSVFRKAAWSLLRCQINKMKHYRKVILLSNTSETNVTYMPRRASSISSDKNKVVIDFPNNKLEMNSDIRKETISSAKPSIDLNLNSEK